MAGSHTSTCSSSYENYTLKSNNNDQKKPKCSLLLLSGNDLIWEGNLESLKIFVETELQINGGWSTPRGEKFKFSNPEFSLKWDGVTDKTITVMQDNDESQLYNTLRSYATLTNAIIDENLQNEIEHMANVDTEADETSHDISAESDNKQNSCEQCDSYKDDLAKLLVMISEIKEKQDEECQNNTETDSKIKALLYQNDKMAAEIATVRATVEEITEENRVIRIVLDQKQHEWTKTETKSRKVKEPKANNATNPIKVLTASKFSM